MKIRIQQRPVPTGEENEVILLCDRTDAEIREAIEKLKTVGYTLTGSWQNQTAILKPEDIFYIEIVDGRAFAYMQENVWQLSKSLETLELELESSKFFRVSKSVLVNLSRIAWLESTMGNRITATLENGEKVIISRHYAKILRAYLK